MPVKLLELWELVLDPNHRPVGGASFSLYREDVLCFSIGTGTHELEFSGFLSCSG